jgi:hypothetical protein
MGYERENGPEMTKRRGLLLVAALVSIVGCSEPPRVDPAQTRAIFEDARSLLETYRSNSEIELASWPPSLRALEPESVRSTEEGLYVVTWSRSVEERGVFVPRDAATFSPEQGTDPEYRLISNAVFVYRIRG